MPFKFNTFLTKSDSITTSFIANRELQIRTPNAQKSNNQSPRPSMNRLNDTMPSSLSSSIDSLNTLKLSIKEDQASLNDFGEQASLTGDNKSQSNSDVLKNKLDHLESGDEKRQGLNLESLKNAGAQISKPNRINQAPIDYLARLLCIKYLLNVSSDFSSEPKQQV